MLGKIKEIDRVLNDKKLLEEEYIKRNKDLPEYNKIFSMAHLSEILIRQRKKIMTKMEEKNKILDPNHYVKVKTDLEKKIQLLKNIDLGNKKEKKKKQYLIKLQEIVIKCIKKKIENVQKKEDIINLIYQIRYFNYIYLDENTLVKDEEVLKNKTDEIQTILIKKGFDSKVLLKITKDEGVNIDIFKLLFQTRVINLEKIFIEVISEQQIVGYLYDSDILEKKISINEIDKQDILFKMNKKMKLII